MADLKDLQNWFEDDELKLPPLKSKAHPKGKRYTVQSPDIETGAFLSQLAALMSKAAAGHELSEQDAERLKLNDQEEREFGRLVLGDTYDELVEDQVSSATLKKVIQYAFAHYAMSPETAEKIANPKAQDPTNRAERRVKTKKASSTAK